MSMDGLTDGRTNYYRPLQLTLGDNYSPVVKNGPTPGATILHKLLKGKTLKLFFTENRRPRPFILSM